ncbi:M48 family metallopeptidase [Candidatus Uhrbacteria bacterium]|nr:M48 family metallopeptidase [Candidatus Uhrbacteria bacterium]
MFAVFLFVVIGVGWIFARAYGDPSILYIAVALSLFMNVAAYWWSDRLVLAMARARPVTRENARELYNIVENLCIAAGLPVPKVYLIDEQAPNAFATGRNPEHAVVAVTTGLLARLDRSELEGVIAHELSHIGNRDMLVSTAAVVLVGFIALLSDFFMRSLWFGGRRRDRNTSSVMLLIGVAAAILAPLAAMLMRLAISRRREFLADASGALLTRYPDALASALQKISSDPTPLTVAQNTTSHLWIDDPFKGTKKRSFLHKLFMTHPPVEERVRALKGMRV